MIMTLDEARAILGNEAEAMTDEQLEQLIYDLDFIARASLKMAREDLLEAKKEEIKKRNTGRKKKD